MWQHLKAETSYTWSGRDRWNKSGLSQHRCSLKRHRNSVMRPHNDVCAYNVQSYDIMWPARYKTVYRVVVIETGRSAVSEILARRTLEFFCLFSSSFCSWEVCCLGDNYNIQLNGTWGLEDKEVAPSKLASARTEHRRSASSTPKCPCSCKVLQNQFDFGGLLPETTAIKGYAPAPSISGAT
jgi:hypothetical protein